MSASGCCRRRRRRSRRTRRRMRSTSTRPSPPSWRSLRRRRRAERSRQWSRSRNRGSPSSHQAARLAGSRGSVRRDHSDAAVSASRSGLHVSKRHLLNPIALGYSKSSSCGLEGRRCRASQQSATGPVILEAHMHVHVKTDIARMNRTADTWLHIAVGLDLRSRQAMCIYLRHVLHASLL